MQQDLKGISLTGEEVQQFSVNRENGHYNVAHVSSIRAERFFDTG